MTQQYGPPPPYHQYPGPYGPPPPYPPPSNGMATAGFVVALVGAVLALIPFLGIVSWLISPVGLVLSIVGRNAAARHQGAGRGLAVAGIVLGIVGLLICVLWATAIAAATSSSNTGSTYYSAPSSSAPTGDGTRTPVL